MDDNTKYLMMVHDSHTTPFHQKKERVRDATCHDGRQKYPFCRIGDFQVRYIFSQVVASASDSIGYSRPQQANAVKQC